MALLGVGFALLSRSEAILLDGLFSGVNFAMGLLMLRVSRLVERPPDKQFHFGYAAFEPLFNALRAMVLLGMCLLAAVSAVDALLHGGRPLQATAALGYAVAALTACLLMALLQRSAARRSSSPLLQTDAHSWLVDAGLSGVVAVAFGLAFGLGGSRWSHLVPYIDPALVLLVVLLILRVPVGLLGRSLGELLWFAPDKDLQTRVERRFADVLSELPVARHELRMLRIGRYLWLFIQILADPGQLRGGVSELDKIRQRIYVALEGVHPRLVIDVVFVEDPRWLE